MQTLTLSLLASLILSILLTSSSSATLPDDAQVVQAEAMALDGEGWTLREHAADSWYIG